MLYIYILQIEYLSLHIDTAYCNQKSKIEYNVYISIHTL